jgi:hypothetical protein
MDVRKLLIFNGLFVFFAGPARGCGLWVFDIELSQCQQIDGRLALESLVAGG